MAIASLTTWLTNPDRQYDQGLLIYEQYGTNQVTLALLRSGSSSYHFSKLQKSLEELNLREDLVPIPIVIGEYIPEDIVSPGKPVFDYKSAPDIIIDIRDNKNKSFAQARKLFEVIRVMDSKDHRLAAALELLDHMDHVQESWGAIDAWQNTGEIKQIAVEAEIIDIAGLSHAQLLREQGNLMSNICKDKTQILTTSKPGLKLKASARLKFREDRLAKVRERLGNEFV
ncbi:hypothetical protein ACVWYN_002698 [Pedobacter sp. UYP24]